MQPPADRPPKRAYRFGQFLIDPSERLLLRDDTSIALTPKAFDLLVLLVENAGHLLEKELLMNRLWSDTFVEEANLSNNISLLRKALGEGENGTRYIETIPKRGYRFIADVELPYDATSAARDKTIISVRHQTPELPKVAATPAHSWTRKQLIVGPVAILMGIIAVVIAIGRSPDRTSPPPSIRFVVVPPPGTSLPPRPEPISPSIAPDGTRLAFHVVRGGQQVLAVRSLDALQSRVLAGTEGGRFPFWSPDSRVIAFFAAGKLKKISVTGGPVQTICEAGIGFGGTWNRDGLIVFAPNAASGLFQVPAAGGQPAALTSLQRNERYHHHPHFLPDGRQFLYFAWPDGVYVGSLDRRAPERVLTSDRTAFYSPPGYLVFVQNRTLLAQRFDLDRRAAFGEPVAIGESLAVGPPGGAAFSVSETGLLAYATSPQVSVKLGWVDRAGQPRGTIGPFPFTAYGSVELSPDGTQIAMESRAGANSDFDIWRFELNQRHAMQVTFSAALDRRPIWSPDGRVLLFASGRKEGAGIYQKPAGGDEPEKLLLRSERREEDAIPRPSDWSSKGIVYEQITPETRDMDLWILPRTGDRKPYPLVREPGIQSDAKFSPDAEWIAYTSDESGRPEIFVQRVSKPGVKWRISIAGGSMPRWRRDGRELFYIATDGMMMTVPVAVDGTKFQPGVPQSLFQTGLSLQSPPVRAFNVTPDGQRFLISVSEDPDITPSIVVVSNWQPR
jgi:eukaryotic-like serine/threonine-protein kinase